MKRAAVTSIVVAAAVFGSAVAAGAQAEDWAELGSAAVYAGERTVVCQTPEGRSVEAFEVGQANGVVVTRDAAGVVRASTVAEADRWQVGDGYEAVDRGTGRFLERSVQVVEIRDGSVVRLRVRIDHQTGVVLSTDVFNADGAVYCSTRFVSFSPGDAGVAAGVTLADPDLSVADAFDGAAMPASVADFERLTVTAGPQPEIVSGLYSDGVFSFTLLHAPRAISIPELAGSPSVEIAGDTYQREFLLGTAVVAWSSGQGGYVLVGDLPLDLQADVLAELPAPRRSFFERLFSLFD